MENTSLTSSSSTAEFFKTLGAHQKIGDAPRPIYLTLDGKTGQYVEKTYLQGENRSEKKPFLGSGAPWQGSILFVHWFAKSPYKEGSTVIRRTREFPDFNSQIEYIEIDYSKSTEPKTIGHYTDYASFKQAMQEDYGRMVNEAIAKKDPIPDQKEWKPELWGSVYIYHFGQNRVVNLKVKGKSRSALFDYLGDWKPNQNVDSISQVLTTFDTKEFTEPQKYYAVNLKTDSVLDEPYQEKVKEAVLATLSWMKSFKDETEEPVKVVSVDEPPF